MAVPTEAALVERVATGLYINGDWLKTPTTLAVEDPSTGETLAEVADATEQDALAALEAAHRAQRAWAQTPARDRGEILRRAYEEITARTDELALLMTLEMGKPLAESRGVVAYAAEFFRWFSEEAVRIDGRYADAPNRASRLLVMKQPVGPCLLITPWNFPLAMGTRKIGPAIAAGCTIVVKPAKQTPLSMLALAEVLERAGLPAGVLNVITSTSASRVMGPLIADPRARKLSFTGSTEVGRTLVEQSRQLLRVSMELGGNAPFLVFEDADVEEAVEDALLAKMRNGGEACTAANRFYVHEQVMNAFASRLAARMGALTVGRGTQPGVDVGPLIDSVERDKVAALVDDARDGGATALTGGQFGDGPGWFYEPTVLVDLPDNARVLGEEIFGPVAPLRSFSDEDEAIAAANATEYGLVAYLYTNDLRRAMRVSEQLETGMLGINQAIVSNAAAPFGGAKHSALAARAAVRGSRSTWRPAIWPSPADWSIVTPHISYVDPTSVTDPELLEIMERARTFGTPRPESQSIRLHHPEVMKAFNQAWEVFFRQGVCDHAIKELCRLYISKSVQCEYCGGQRSVLAQQQGATEAQVDEILDFESSDRFDDRERTALEWALAIAWDPSLAADDLWNRLHQHFTEPQLVELGHFIALTLGQQRFLKTVAIAHGEVLADTDAGLAPVEAAAVRAAGAQGA